MKTDKLFYRLFLTHPELALELAGMQAPYPKGYQQRALELKETGLRLDGVLHPPSPAWPHMFWEAQFQPDDTFYARWFATIFTCLRQEKITKWRGLVLLPDRSLDVGDPAPYTPLLEHRWIRHVYLEDLQDTETKTQSWGIALLRLIATPEHQVSTMAADLLAATEGEKSVLARDQTIDLLETVLVYKLPHLSREEIRIMLHLPDTDLKQTRFYREAFAEGELRGEAQGKVLGELTLILRLLGRRFGAVSPRHEAAIRTLSSEQLEILGEDLLDFRNKADLDAWLKRNG